MKIKLVKNQKWSVGEFKKDQILEVGVDVPERIGTAMLAHGYAEEVGVKPPPSADSEGDEEVKEEDKFKNELIDKVSSMTKKELIDYAKKNKIELSDENAVKADLLNEVLEFMEGGK